MKTTPKPPSPICSSSLYGPITVAGPLAHGRLIDGGDRAGVGAFGQLAVPAVPTSRWASSSASTWPRRSGSPPQARSRKAGRSLGGVPLHGLQEDRLCRVGVRVHGASLSAPHRYSARYGAEIVSEKSETSGGASARSPSRAWSQARA